MKEFRLSEDDFVAAQRLHHGWKARWLPLLICAVYAAYMLYDSVRSPGPAGWVNLGVFTGIFALIFLVILPLWQRRQMKGIYAEHRALREPVTVTFDDDFVQWSSGSGTGRLRWEDVLRYRENEKMFLVYVSRNLMRVVLKRAFESDEELEAFSSRLKRPR